MASALTISDKQQTAKTSQKIAKSVNSKSRLRLNIHGGVQLYTSTCMHVLSLMVLALVVSEKLTKTQTT